MSETLDQAGGALALTDENDLRVELAEWARGSASVEWVRRLQVQHTQPPGRPCLVVLAGARAVFPATDVPVDARCLLTFGAGLPEISPDGLEVFVAFRTDGGAETVELFRAAVADFDAARSWAEVEVDVGAVAGRRGEFLIGCDPGPDGDSAGDWLAVYEFVVSPARELTLNRARAFADYRAKNEIAIFSQTYEHAIYNEGERRGGGIVRSIGRGLKRLFARGAAAPVAAPQPAPTEGPAPTGRPAAEAAPTKPAPPVNLYTYYTGLLMRRLEIGDVVFRDFLERRLHAIPDRPIRILSLASGAARIEEGILDGLDPARLELTLTDLNQDLLAKARTRLEGKARLETKALNLNELSLPQRTYDVILCVSALHHVVELERLFEQVAGALIEGGEFWSIGEYIGRNGSRLFGDAYELADGFFRELPERYRVNRNPGSNGAVDAHLPNFDCAITCFEGIRSEEIEDIMARHLEPVEVIRFDCFLWRLFNLAYLDNYDLSREQDNDIVERAMQLEIDFYRRGGQPSSMFGVFRPASIPTGS